MAISALSKFINAVILVAYIGCAGLTSISFYFKLSETQTSSYSNPVDCLTYRTQQLGCYTNDVNVCTFGNYENTYEEFMVGGVNGLWTKYPDVAMNLQAQGIRNGSMVLIKHAVSCTENFVYANNTVAATWGLASIIIIGFCFVVVNGFVFCSQFGRQLSLGGFYFFTFIAFLMPFVFAIWLLKSSPEARKDSIFLVRVAALFIVSVAAPAAYLSVFRVNTTLVVRKEITTHFVDQNGQYLNSKTDIKHEDFGFVNYREWKGGRCGGGAKGVI
eukprot:TRINITY_DN5679_c0_g1_i1.p1 TRINITY_DN5679_c0_g1~~TRINITY_DN5679_c0_g1_i1.p1  ORF type:complete len:273 (+),score=36.89 TRINITY_DN5679_c0_g1_i1:125-943(+)